ncbi:MAG: hypothetical protein AB7U46_16610 [Paenirhodobacter sp.]|uniref:hypothetical protein n=1 Tax=Paenirhodobacter sp. TaxID=1965326 RepID=UPI003D0CEE14
MNEKTPETGPGKTRAKAPSEASREERLAAALRANLARRKAQARARAADAGGDEAEGNE